VRPFRSPAPWDCGPLWSSFQRCSCIPGPLRPARRLRGPEKGKFLYSSGAKPFCFRLAGWSAASGERGRSHSRCGICARRSASTLVENNPLLCVEADHPLAQNKPPAAMDAARTNIAHQSVRPYCFISTLRPRAFSSLVKTLKDSGTPISKLSSPRTIAS
jgi:hypothetical protein